MVGTHDASLKVSQDRSTMPVPTNQYAPAKKWELDEIDAFLLGIKITLSLYKTTSRWMSQNWGKRVLAK